MEAKVAAASRGLLWVVASLADIVGNGMNSGRVDLVIGMAIHLGQLVVLVAEAVLSGSLSRVVIVERRGSRLR